MKRSIWLVLFLFVLTSCGQYGVQQLTNDDNRFIPLPSNKDQNHEKKAPSTEVVSYAKQYENFLVDLFLQYDDIKTFFYENKMSEKEKQQAIRRVDNMIELVEKMDKERAPKPFQDLKAFHNTLLIELKMLHEALRNFTPNDKKNAQLARLYFENIVSYHKSMQLEYRITTSELGIF